MDTLYYVQVTRVQSAQNVEVTHSRVSPRVKLGRQLAYFDLQLTTHDNDPPCMSIILIQLTRRTRVKPINRRNSIDTHSPSADNHVYLISISEHFHHAPNPLRIQRRSSKLHQMSHDPWAFLRRSGFVQGWMAMMERLNLFELRMYEMRVKREKETYLDDSIQNQPLHTCVFNSNHSERLGKR
jgi:hypothetical protein